MHRFRTLYNEATLEAPPAGSGTPAPAAAAPAPSSPPPPGPPPIGAKGELPEGWHLNLGDEFAPHAAQAAQFKSVGDLFKSYAHLRAHGPAYPGEGSTPDDVARFRALAQVPEKPADYGLAKPENLPPGVEWDDAAVGKIAEIAHAHHVPAPALKAILAAHIEQEGTRAQHYADEMARMSKEAEDALVGEWRGNFEQNSATARHVAGKLAEQLGIPKDDPAFAAVTAHPMVKRMMLQVSKLTAEDPTRGGTFTDLRSAGQRADAIMAGTDAEWGKKYQEGDQSAYNVVAQLLKEAGGSK